MTFQAFRGSAFNHSHENKAFNELHDLLKQHWAEQGESLYLFGNFFVGGREFDALVVKRNALIVIDFKNFGGDVRFSENGRWTCGGVHVKGGNSVNPYQQLRTNKFALLEYIQGDRLSLKSQPNLGHIAALTLFQQPIKFDELQIPAKIRSWFHVGDMCHAVRTIDSIASPSIDLLGTDFESLIKAFDVPAYFPDGYPETKAISSIKSDSTPAISWTEGQQRVLVEASELLEGDTTALVVTGMVSTGKRTMLAELIKQVEQQGFAPMLLAPSTRIAQRYQLSETEDCYSIYTFLYNSQPSKIEKNTGDSGIGVGVHDIKLTPKEVEGKCLIIVDAHLLGNSYSSTDTRRFGTGFLVNDFLNALGKEPPKIVLVGDPYQLTRGDLKLSFLHGNAFEERGFKAKRVTLDEQIRPDSKQQGILDYQFGLAEQLKHQHFNRLPAPDAKQVCEVDKNPSLPNELSMGHFHAVYLCALNAVAHRINLAVRQSLRPQGNKSLEVGDWVDFYNRTPVVQETYDTADCDEQEAVNITAGNIGVVEWVSGQEEVHYIQLKGRDEPTRLCFKVMRCKVRGSASVNVRYLPDFLVNEKPELPPDQLLAMNIFARQQAEIDFKYLKLELEQLKKSNSEEGKKKYKSKKKALDVLIYRRVMTNGYFNAAQIRFAYAMTVHRAQGRKWSYVTLNAERSSGGESHHNDGYFRYLYTAAACSSTKLSLQKYPRLNPLSQCIFKVNPRCEIGSFNILRPLQYDRTRVPTSVEAKLAHSMKLAAESSELIALFLVLKSRLDDSQWQIESISQHAYQEHYTFINTDEQKALARLSYKGDFTVSNVVWVDEGVDQVDLQDLQKRVYGNSVFNTWEVEEAVNSLDALLLPAGFSSSSFKESSYRAQVDFNHNQGSIQLEVNVSKKGLVSSIRPIRASDERVISIVQQLVESE